jgi:hypothetical protein
MVGIRAKEKKGRYSLFTKDKINKGELKRTGQVCMGEASRLKIGKTRLHTGRHETRFIESLEIPEIRDRDYR